MLLNLNSIVEHYEAIGNTHLNFPYSNGAAKTHPKLTGNHILPLILSLINHQVQQNVRKLNEPMEMWGSISISQFFFERRACVVVLKS